MTTQKYRTHQGRQLDIGALILKNEKTRAVGNMGVNARGDRVDADNRPIDSRVNQITRQYRRQTTNVTDQPVRTSSADVGEDVPNPAPIQAQSQPVVEPRRAPEPVPEETVAGGLAAAIARARNTGTTV